MGILDKATAKVQAELNKRNPPANTNTTTYDNTHNSAHGQGLVPGSHANNPNAIPTAGGQQVGGNTVYNDAPGMNAGSNTAYNNAGVHQTAGDKMQNALPGQHGNAHDAHGNSVDVSGPGHNTHTGAHTGPHAGGLTGAHNTHSTHNTHTGPDNRGMMDKAKDAMSSNRTNQPDDPITGTNYDQNNRNTHTNDHYNTGSGITGSNTHHPGGLTGGNTYSTHDQHGHDAGPDNRGMMDKAKDAMSSNRSNRPDDPVTGTNYDQNNRNTHDNYGHTGAAGVAGSNTHHQGGLTGSNTHTSHGVHDQHNAGPDNRGMVDKAKDVLSSKRSNHPDDPVIDTNYDQNTYNTHNTHSTGGVTGTNDPYHQAGTGFHGNTTHHQTRSSVTGSNVHSTHATHGQDNRGMMDKAKDMLSSKRSNHPDDPVTGTNYDQKNTAGVHGNAYGQQPGVGGYNAPGSGPAPNY
ncbi:unnamed protein product [Zymoseptoria tritici ST99CH_1A5]|uniref:Uncharacterized protein n=2 Tax=Zymoseptoria tritici TaxID=1047171 RepID=A0A1X7RWD0_ZYMT9|nr:unnamed protein product [Zymoseptoria tritici ST99CH_3D7]SMR55977.1 unnamed protein product [Zymoseptoria tritici ST99CH_3D1]SMY25164.1 unnamed protein product [Zymoseptoria tritici ST99CH_1A5]